MPETLAFAAFQAGAPLAVVNAIAGVGIAGAITHFAVGTALAVGASAALSALAQPPRLQKPSDGQVEVKEPVAARLRHYGRLKVSGSVTFEATSENGDEIDLIKIINLASHEIDAIESHYFAGSPYEIDDDGFVLGNFYSTDDQPYIQIFPHFGTDDQLADPFMMERFPDAWTSAHRGRGITYIVNRYRGPATVERLGKVFPQGAPEYQALIRAAKLYDPTKDSTNGGSGSHRMNDKSTWEWSEEQRLIMLDFLVHPDCYGKGFERIDWTSWVPQILRGREPVPLKDGGTDPRWLCATTVNLADEEKTAAFTGIRQAGDARIFFTSEEKIGCMGGGWDAPTVSLSANEHLIEAEFGPADRMAGYNVLKFKFLSPRHDYVEQDGDPWRDEAAIAAAGGVERETEVDLTAVPRHSQGRRLCKLMNARDNAPFTGSVVAKMPGLQAIREDAIDFSFAELDGGSGDIDGPWWVDGEISADIETGTVSLGLKKADPTSSAWDADTEEGDGPRVPGDLPGNVALLDDTDEILTDDVDVGILFDEAA